MNTLFWSYSVSSSWISKLNSKFISTQSSRVWLTKLRFLILFNHFWAQFIFFEVFIEIIRCYNPYWLQSTRSQCFSDPRIKKRFFFLSMDLAVFPWSKTIFEVPTFHWKSLDPRIGSGQILVKQFELSWTQVKIRVFEIKEWIRVSYIMVCKTMIEKKNFFKNS